ncbi:MAG TPA: hypothetical protein VN229_02710, partial [Terriglobales bacterium]|nr:hypothetical protein [Terriglobales bacterium]
TVSVDHGTLTFGSHTGLTLGNGDSWTNDSSITLTGSEANIDAALATLSYTATSGVSNGSDTLHVTTTDGSLSDTDTTAITIQHTVLGATDSITAPSGYTTKYTGNADYTDNGNSSLHVIDAATNGQHNDSGGGHTLTNNTSHSDWLDGGNGNDALHAGSGGDYLTGGGGTDTYYGGAGNDVMILDSSDMSTTTRHIDGAGGDDLIDLSGVSSWNFVGASANASSGHFGITNVEVLNLEGGSGTSVTLDPTAVLDMTDSRNTLVIRADSSGDTVNLTHSAGDSAWTQQASQVAGTDGRTYDIYTATHSGTTATVWVEHEAAANVHLS